MNTIAVKVVNKTQEAQDIVSFELAAADGQALPPFSAGSHIDVHIGDGLIRQYSLCNDPAETHRYQIAVLRDPASRGGSIAAHERINAGDTIQVSAPRNHFELGPADDYLLLAGGIGVTPILCMAERLAKTDARFSMHYCARSAGRAAFLDRIAASPFRERVQLHFDDAGQKLELAGLLGQAGAGTHLYVCGPQGFIDHVTNSARAAGWAEDRIHLEYFGAAPQDTAGDVAFEVKLASSGQVYTIPADKSVCNALLEHGIDIPISCEQGVCGTCITRVLEGTPEHRDLYFTDEEKAANDQFTPCCSRARSRLLVLDL